GGAAPGAGALAATDTGAASTATLNFKLAALSGPFTLAGSGAPIAVGPDVNGTVPAAGDVYDASELALLSGSGQGTTAELLPGTRLGATQPQSATWAADAYFATASGLTALENPLEQGTGTPDEKASP